MRKTVTGSPCGLRTVRIEPLLLLVVVMFLGIEVRPNSSLFVLLLEQQLHRWRVMPVVHRPLCVV